MRRRRRKVDGDADVVARGMEVEGVNGRSLGRECPVPKPGGVVGRVMGFERREAVGVVVKGRDREGES